MRRYDLRLFADYCQFYLQDESAGGDVPYVWSEEALARRLALGPGTVGIRTKSADFVRVTIEMLASAPADDGTLFDGVIECHLAVIHGPLVAMGCTDYFPDAIRVPAEPGIYRVRASYLCHVDDTERYRLQLWQAPAIERPVVLKARAD